MKTGPREIIGEIRPHLPSLSEQRRGRKSDGEDDKPALDMSTDSSQAGAMSNGVLVNENKEVDLLHEIGSRFAAADSLHEVLGRVVEFLSGVAQFDSCFVYVLEENELVLRASKNPHAEIVDRLKLQVGRGITGWWRNINSRWLWRAMRSKICDFNHSMNCRRTGSRRFSRCQC